jgi:hypothetical protein
MTRHATAQRTKIDFVTSNTKGMDGVASESAKDTERAIIIAYMTICEAFDHALVADVCGLIGRCYLGFFVQDITAPYTFHGLPATFCYTRSPVTMRYRNWFLRALEKHHPDIMINVATGQRTCATRCYIYKSALGCMSCEVYLDDPSWGNSDVYNQRLSFKILSAVTIAS